VPETRSGLRESFPEAAKMPRHCCPNSIFEQNS
jgi:hypothetical protein